MVSFPFELTTVFVVCTALAYFFYNLKRRYDFWKDRGVPQVGFSMDYLANFWKNRVFNVQDVYNVLTPLPYGGFYQVGVPYLMILDLELIRSILIKDFSQFTDHGVFAGLENDPLMRSNVFNLTGLKWKNVRAKLTPIFSSGKLRRMSILMNECTKLLDKFLEQAVDEKSEIEIRGLLQKFTADTIGICAFGINCNTIENKNSEFRRVIKVITAPGLFIRSILMMLLNSVLPKKIRSYIKLKMVHSEVTDFFHSIVMGTMKNREDAKIKREDFLQLLINVRAEEQDLLQKENDDSAPLFDDELCMANAFIFFVAGFDPISATLSHCLYYLALYPEVMEKLHQEIKHVQQSNGGKIDYDVLKKMQYMDCVISETLRLSPPAAWVERVCTKPYQLPDSSLVIKENTHLMVPMQAIHLDPKYFLEPQRYNPDRFNDENKTKIIPGSYFPFGDGPRICIAQRFALMEMKAALALIIGKYTVQPSGKTEIPLKLNPFSFANIPKRMYLQFRRREN